MSDTMEIHVRITPKASKNAINGWAEDENGKKYLKVSLTAVPEKGKANKALVNLLAKEWRIPKSSIEIIRGYTNKNKSLILHNIPACLENRAP